MLLKIIKIHQTIKLLIYKELILSKLDHMSMKLVQMSQKNNYSTVVLSEIFMISVRMLT